MFLPSRSQKHHLETTPSDANNSLDLETLPSTISHSILLFYQVEFFPIILKCLVVCGYGATLACNVPYIELCTYTCFLRFCKASSDTPYSCWPLENKSTVNLCYISCTTFISLAISKAVDTETRYCACKPRGKKSHVFQCIYPEPTLGQCLHLASLLMSFPLSESAGASSVVSVIWLWVICVASHGWWHLDKWDVKEDMTLEVFAHPL